MAERDRRHRAEEGSGWAKGAVLFKVVVYDSYTNLYKDIKALFIKKLSPSCNCVRCVCKDCSV